MSQKGAARSLVRLRIASTRILGRLHVLPEFLIIGAQRAGTTSLFNYIVQHPAVAPPTKKEVHYFDLRYQLGSGWYRSHFPLRASRWRLERRAGLRMLSGEASPYYLFHPQVPARVSKLLPRVKSIVLLRNPVERAYSHYKHELELGMEHLDFAEAIEAESARLGDDMGKLMKDERYYSRAHQHFTYLARGRYVEQLEHWAKWFDSDQLMIVCSEEFFADPERRYREVLAFLELPAWSPGSYDVYNATPSPEMDPSARVRLQEYFQPHNERLFRYLGRELPWEA